MRLALPVLLLALSATTANAQNNDSAGVVRTIDEFKVALEGGKPRQFANLFAEDADFTNWVDKLVHGRENIYQHHINVFEHRPLTRTIHVLSHSIRFLTPDVAAVEIRWDNKHTKGPDGTTLPDRDGVWVSVMTKENGRWVFKVARNVMLNDGSKALDKK